jgi:ABC-type phosphate transport system substrate-binding protein
MRHLQYFLLAALTFGAAAANAEDFKVIGNPGIKLSEISANDLKDIFLATKTDAAVGTYFRSLVFTGKASMPKSVASDSDVVAYVEKTKGAIGYVGSATSTGDAKVLNIK